MTHQQVLYLHNNPASQPVQVFIAQALGALHQLRGTDTIAFGFYPYGKIPPLPEEVYQEAQSFEPFIPNYIDRMGFLDSCRLFQFSHRQEMLEGRLELWGVEDHFLLEMYQKNQREHWKLQEPGKMNILRRKDLEKSLEELKMQRVQAIVANIQRMMAEQNIPLLPLVMSYGEYQEISQTFEDSRIKVISYEGY